MRSVWLVLGLALVVVALLLLLDARSGGDRHAAPDPSAPARAQAPELLTSERSAPNTETPADGAAHDAGDEATQPEHRLYGTFELVDEHGRAVPQPSGRLHFAWHGSARRSADTITAAKGRWSIVLEKAGRIRIHEAVVDGRNAIVSEADSWIGVPSPDQSIRVVAKLARETVLRVVDAATGGDLADVTVTRGADDWQSELEHPGPYAEEDLIRRGATSPLRLSPTAEDVEFGSGMSVFARAPGYAWGRIAVDWASGGERMLRLEPGGDLTVVLTGTTPESGELVVRRKGQSYPWAFEQDVDALGTWDLRGLVPGAYEIVVQVGHWSSKQRVIARAERDVRVGARTSTMLDVPPVPRAKRVSVTGTVHLPEGYPRLGGSLEFRLLNPPAGAVKTDVYGGLTAVEDRPGTYAFVAPGLLPGRYQVLVGDTQYRMALEVPATGARDVRIDHPPRGLVSVNVVDEATGQDAGVHSLTWRYRLPKGVRSWSYASAKRNEENGLIEFHAPAGEVSLRVSDDRYTHATRRIQIEAGRNDVELRVKRASRIHVVLRDGDTRIPIDLDLVLEVAGPGRSRGRRGGEVWLDLEGTYTLTVGAVPGFEPIAPRKVEVTAGETTEVVIQLERVR